MTESITREEAEELLENEYEDANDILETLFPPKLTFKKGEVIAVRNYNTDQWVYHELKSMESGFYCCYIGAISPNTHNYKFARSQTDGEKGK